MKMPSPPTPPIVIQAFFSAAQNQRDNKPNREGFDVVLTLIPGARQP